MKKFRFNMKTLLMVRQQQEEAAQREVMLARQKLQKIVEILEELKRECDHLEQDLREKQASPHSIHEYKDHFLYFQFLREKIAQQQDDVLQAQNAVEVKREAVTKAMQNKKVIEKIKDKQYTSWKDHYQKMEAKLLDELATLRHIRVKERLSDES